MKTYQLLFAAAIPASIAVFGFRNNAPVEMKSTKADTITVRTKSKKGEKIPVVTYATSQNIDSMMKEKRAVIIHYGLVPVYNPEFEKKYGVEIHNLGCVVSSGEDDPVKINNTLISEYLTKNYGDSWKKDLGFKPFGTENQL